MKRRKKEQTGGAAAAVQVRERGGHPFAALRGYMPLGGADAALYRSVREAVPIVDAAIGKLVRLSGGFRVLCEDERAQEELGEFLRTVNVGHAQVGFNAFLDKYLDSLLTNGRAVGEIVPDAEGREIAAVLCHRVEQLALREGETALEKLSELFVGRTGIFDHSWSAGGQTARIYRAEVIEEETRTTAGDKYCWCKGWAYMLRTEKNAELIAEIEGGIKKEVSVGCSAAKRSCSICGKDAGLCEHERGKYYGGKLCYAVLSDITDAYEWSFVAVPAQRAAGVVKRFGQSEGSLKAMVRACGSRAQMRELEELEKLSALGKSYLGALRREVRRLMLVADETLDGAVAESVTEKLGERELLELKKAFGARAAKKLGTNVQIVDPREKREENERDFCV